MQEREPLPENSNGEGPYYVMWKYKDLEGKVHDCITQALSWETAELMLMEIPGARLFTEQAEVGPPNKAEFCMTWD